MPAWWSRGARLLVATGEPGRATWPIQNDSLTWMPPGEMSVKLRRRCVERTAISSAIHPPKGLPDDVNAGEAERLDGIEIAIGEIGNVIDPGRRLRAAETGTIGHDHVETLRQTYREGPAIPRAHRCHADNQGTPLPLRARLSWQPLTSIVCRANSMINCRPDPSPQR